MCNYKLMKIHIVCNCNVLNVAFSSVLFTECINDKKSYYPWKNLLRSKCDMDTR